MCQVRKWLLSHKWRAVWYKLNQNRLLLGHKWILKSPIYSMCCESKQIKTHSKPFILIFTAQPLSLQLYSKSF